MFSLGTFLYFIFHLAVGTSTFDIEEFARLKGEWQVEGVTAEGVKLPPQEYKGKKFVFAEASSPVKANSAVLSGKLRTKGKMSWLETKTVATVAPDAKTSGEAVAEEYSCSYEIKGKTMRLLMIRVQKPNDRGPGPILANQVERGVLFELRRK